MDCLRCLSRLGAGLEWRPDFWISSVEGAPQLSLFHHAQPQHHAQRIKPSQMPPPRKKARTARNTPKDDPSQEQSSILTDSRTSWLLKSDEQMVELKVKNETFQVAKSVLTKNSEYFEGCLNGRFSEAKKRTVDFGDDEEIDSRYLALYIGLAYSSSSIVPHTIPRPSKNPQASAPKTPMRDYVEVYKLCDRFISPAMGEFIESCIDVAIRDGHRALFRTAGDEGMQKVLMRDFADAYEALRATQTKQQDIGNRMVSYFCEGVSYNAWFTGMEELVDRPKFIAHVSRGFAGKLRDLQHGRKLKRKELAGPGSATP
ncbi:hypothetical protein FALBO_5688 [Fusarium albosuccineum]|uniref:BTB domain-containing protein n=1 Tax=Fusarium albosuccineum TaxID=1237068 RepID=A0A8H4LFL9_9HYPO|nr:hypothetical protein FALBO_5688 [Fusarium albosuccineum]